MLGAGDEAQRARFDGTSRWIEQSPCPIGVSLVELGEAFLMLSTFPDLRPANHSPWDRWKDLIDQRKVEVCWLDNHVPTGALLGRAEKIRAAMAGQKLGATDSLILASAVLCRSCDLLYSPDKRIWAPELADLRKKASGRRLGLRNWLGD